MAEKSGFFELPCRDCQRPVSIFASKCGHCHRIIPEEESKQTRRSFFIGMPVIFIVMLIAIYFLGSWLFPSSDVAPPPSDTVVESAKDFGCLDYKYGVQSEVTRRIMVAIDYDSPFSVEKQNLAISRTLQGDGDEVRFWFAVKDKNGKSTDMLATGPINTDTCEVGPMMGQVGGVLFDDTAKFPIP